MKKLFLLLALLGMVAVGCSKDDADKGNDNKTEQPNENEGGSEDNIPENIFFGLDKESVTISPDGGSVDVIVYSNYKWEISGTSDWCTPSVKGGDANEDGQKVSFSADVTYDDREATFWFRCADKQIKFVVSQKSNNAFIYYTSYDGEIVTPYDSSSFDATIASNTYIDGVGVIEFDAPITTIGYKAFYDCSSLTSITIPDSVTTIGKCAFEYCSRLTSVTIPDSVTTIGDDAFRGCSSLTSVYMSDISAWCNISFGNYDSNPLYYARNLYLNNELVTDLTIPDSVTTIGTDAFCYCRSLTSVTIPDSVTTIGAGAFNGCSNLTSVTIGDSVTEIGYRVFEDCSSLTSVTIPDSVTMIGYSAFEDCYSLTSVTIGDSVTTIGGGAFCNCSSLTSVTIPDSVTMIGNEAFFGCSSLTSVTIGDSVTTIGNYAFCGCDSLTSVTIPDSVTTIGQYTFCNCESLTSVTIGDSVTTIGNYAFEYCSSLTSVTIPDSVTSIGVSAFSGCSSLQEFNGKFASEDGRCLIIDGVLNSFAPAGLTEYAIPDSVTTIGESAFTYCGRLTSVTIPDSVTTIGYCAFYDCTSLTSVYCKATTPPVALTSSWYWSAFDDNASGRKIYVPMESVGAYKSASYWSRYADAIVGYDF